MNGKTRSPSWETRPELALNAIDRMRLAGDELAPKLKNAERATQRERAATELLSIVEADPEVHGELAVGIAASAAWLQHENEQEQTTFDLFMKCE